MPRGRKKGYIPPPKPPDYTDGGIDAGLLILDAVREDGATFSQAELAEICGCSKVYMSQLERKAVAKFLSGVKERLARQTAPITPPTPAIPIYVKRKVDRIYHRPFSSYPDTYDRE